MAMTIKYGLKPCPFCGGKAVIESPDMPYTNHYARCTGCRIQTQWYQDREKLKRFWNTRQGNEEVDND